MGSLSQITAWLGSQPLLSFLLVGIALYSSAVGIVLLMQSLSEDLAGPCPSDARRAAARALPHLWRRPW